MGKVTGFMELDRVERDYEPVEDRIKHFKEFLIPLDEKKVSEQGARCMDCGIPYCHQGMLLERTKIKKLRFACRRDNAGF